MSENQHSKQNNQNHAEENLQSSQENQDFAANSSVEENENKTIISELESKLASKEKEISELNDKLLRALAEAENIRRRSKEDLEKSAKYGITNFASDLVVVVENFVLAGKNAPSKELEGSETLKNYGQAISMTEKELLKILEKHQVRRIDPLGEQFNHNFHEAIAQIESNEEEGKILAVIQAGYLIADRLIRPALVSVAKKNN